MARSRSFSIFLLKDGYDSTTALRGDNNMIESAPASNLPVGATLFILDGTDTLEPGSARRQRTQHAIETELTYFDFDYDSSVLKSITGKVKAEYADVVKHATGASNLRVSTPVASADLTDLCTRLVGLYADESYLEAFPDIQKIAPVRDPERVAALNQKLNEQIQAQADNIYMSVPDLIDYSHDSDSMYAMFSRAGRSLLYSEWSS